MVRKFIHDLLWRIENAIIIDKKYHRTLWHYVVALFSCQHNARVLADFEDRMSSVLCHATDNLLSKPYYDKDVMISEISEVMQKRYEEGYDDCVKELASMKDALEKCRKQFEHYVSLHMKKTPPDMDKAAANQEMVELCEETLATLGELKGSRA